MKTYLIFLVIFVVGTLSMKWASIENAEESLKLFNSTAEEIIAKMYLTIANNTEKSYDFVEYIDELSTVKEINSLQQSYSCKGKFADVVSLKNSFRYHHSKLTLPLIKRVSDIRGRLNDIQASISVYQGLADSKFWACKLKKEECTQETNAWTERMMQDIVCKLSPDCKKHRTSKRSLSGRCSEGEFECKNGRCIEAYYVCNGDNNCYDYSDEQPDCQRYCFDGFHCNNLRCIRKSQICDDIDDCGDGSDEEGCQGELSANCTLENGYFGCENKNCIKLQEVCNGVDDCGDASDEGQACLQKHCKPDCLSGGGLCFRTPRQLLCVSHCPPNTAENGDWCLPTSKLPPSTVAGLLEEVPRLKTRYLSSYKLLEATFLNELSSSLMLVIECLGSSSNLAKIMNLGAANTQSTANQGLP